jgi:hypothetical protein
MPSLLILPTPNNLSVLPTAFPPIIPMYDRRTPVNKTLPVPDSIAPLLVPASPASVNSYADWVSIQRLVIYSEGTLATNHVVPSLDLDPTSYTHFSKDNRHFASVFLFNNWPRNIKIKGCEPFILNLKGVSSTHVHYYLFISFSNYI